MVGKHANVTAEKKKPIAVIAPQKKEKISKSTKSEKNNKEVQPNAVPHTKMKGCLYLLSLTMMAFGFAWLHMYHVSTMFENDRHFSHLSTLEREMTFRTEMGLYYSYYKTLVEAPSLSDGMLLILNDNVTEYPAVINTLKRFNLYPEVVIGAAFRVFSDVMAWLEIPGKQCWQVERGSGLAPVLSCEGITDPFYYYLHAVWVCAGLTAAFLFLYGVFLSGSVAGGVLTVACFFFNHGESTRVQWTPPLRESFAYPFLLLQGLLVCSMLRHSKFSWRHGVGVAVTTTVSLVCWQFSQFVLAAQVAALVAMFSLGVIRKQELLLILLFLAAGVQHGLLLLLGNELLASSLLVSLLASSLLACVVLEPALRRLPAVPRVGLMLAVTAAATLVIRSRLLIAFATSDDAHIWNLLRAKLGSYRDFHTMLYTCSAEFDFLPPSYLHKTVSTLLLPCVGAVLVTLAARAAKQEKGRPRALDPELVFTLLQLAAYVVMAVLVMRLKLFLTPHLCIVASLLASRKYFGWIRSENVHYAMLAVLLSGMTVQGVQNITEQRSIIGEYSNIQLEQLLEWVKRETPSDAVFAGPMPLMANLLLSTRRPIVNHPHYEDANLRERTKLVYGVFSRRAPQQVYNTLSQMHVQFLVLEDTWCFSESRPGCAMTDVWDVEEPELRHQPALCPRLFLHNPAPFERVFANNEYVVLWLHSQYVELPPLREYKQ